MKKNINEIKYVRTRARTILFYEDVELIIFFFSTYALISKLIVL